MKSSLASNIVLVISSLAYSGLTLCASTEQGYYYGLRLINSEREAENMSSSARPGIGSFVSGEETQSGWVGSFVGGYRFGNGWRVEGELVFPKTDKYTSGSTLFPTSLNVHRVESSRAMLNTYRDLFITDSFGVYGTVGVGLARLASSGWQGNSQRQYAKETQTNLAWSLGAGAFYELTEHIVLDLSYRYVDMGHTESGWNNFSNVRGLQDEKMKANYVSSETLLGVSWYF